MNQFVWLFSIVSTSLFLADHSPIQSLEQRLKSSDQQVRCDAFYELFGSGEGFKNFRTEKLHGKTTDEIHEMLGEPTSIGILEHKETKWLEVHYRFEVCPTKGSNEEKESCKKGWRYGPSLVFRNGISVEWTSWSEETGEKYYSVTPEHLRFKKGGTFP
jgi:hypothetical protein